jgi:trans-2,3-dihydro-3-hydroxyanthranilate isomerase
MSRYPYLHFDVFTDRVFGGNQLAVFPLIRRAGDAPAFRLAGEVPSVEVMQAVTVEMNFSECTFVFPPEQPGTDVRVRIFTPGKELPMAGHPTIGTAFALARAGFVPANLPSVIFGLGVGPTRVDLEWRDSRLVFAWMTQLRPTFGLTIDAVGEVAEALGLAPGDIGGTGLPVEEVSCGVPFVFVPLATRAAVDRARLDTARLARLYDRVGTDDHGVFVFSPEPAGDDASAYSRMFAPGLGVAEDPATGAASGPLGCYLVRHGVVPRDQAGRIVSLQGVKMGRPSQVRIEITLEGDEIARVRVGGRAVYVGEGAIECP